MDSARSSFSPTSLHTEQWISLTKTVFRCIYTANIYIQWNYSGNWTHLKCRSYSKKTVNQLYIYSTVLGAAIKCKQYSEITVESGTHVKSVKITLNIFAVCPMVQSERSHFWCHLWRQPKPMINLQKSIYPNLSIFYRNFIWIKFG